MINYVLDTNVIMDDPNAIYAFPYNTVIIPLQVLEELDRHKTGLTDTARNVRLFSRMINELTDNVLDVDLSIPLNNGGILKFIKDNLFNTIDTVDNQIIAIAKTRIVNNEETVIISNDINLCIKARLEGVPAKSYEQNKIEINTNDYVGHHICKIDSLDLNSIYSCTPEEMYAIVLDCVVNKNVYPNEFVDLGHDLKVRIHKEGNILEGVPFVNYTKAKKAVWGITAKNQEQNYSLNLLMNPEIDLVTLQGPAGTGKTLLTLASGLFQVLDKAIYNEIIFTRATVPIGDDIGFLPGTEEEKMLPWMGAMLDNLELLNSNQIGNAFGKHATQDIVTNKIKIRSLNFMRGRSFNNKYIIIDEAQNLTIKQIKTLITRCGIGTKIVCLGDINQIDTPHLNEYNSGLTYIIDKFKEWDRSGHISLSQGERSPLANYAAKVL